MAPPSLLNTNGMKTLYEFIEENKKTFSSFDRTYAERLCQKLNHPGNFNDPEKAELSVRQIQTHLEGVARRIWKVSISSLIYDGSVALWDRPGFDPPKKIREAMCRLLNAKNSSKEVDIELQSRSGLIQNSSCIQKKRKFSDQQSDPSQPSQVSGGATEGYSGSSNEDQQDSNAGDLAVALSTLPDSADPAEIVNNLCRWDHYEHPITNAAQMNRKIVSVNELEEKLLEVTRTIMRKSPETEPLDAADVKSRVHHINRHLTNAVNHQTEANSGFDVCLEKLRHIAKALLVSVFGEDPEETHLDHCLSYIGVLGITNTMLLRSLAGAAVLNWILQDIIWTDLETISMDTREGLDLIKQSVPGFLSELKKHSRLQNMSDPAFTRAKGEEMSTRFLTVMAQICSSNHGVKMDELKSRVGSYERYSKSLQAGFAEAYRFKMDLLKSGNTYNYHFPSSGDRFDENCMEWDVNGPAVMQGEVIRLCLLPMISCVHSADKTKTTTIVKALVT